MRHLSRALDLSLLGLALLSAGASAAAGGDRMLVYTGSQIFISPLPAGPSGAPRPAAQEVGKILALPSGQVLATTIESAGGAAHPVLHELMPDGSLRRIAGLPGYLVSGAATVLDMELDPRGHVHVLTRFQNGYPPWDVVRISVTDPADGALQGNPEHTAMLALAGGPEGFWGVDRTFSLRKYDPALRAYGPPVLDLGEAGFGTTSGLEADSAGRLYFENEGICGFPPCPALLQFDPQTLAVTAAPWEIYAGRPFSAFSIERFCQETASAICLQEGRFRTEVRYEAYDGAAGSAVVAPARSADTGIFYFFRPENWELMVKVLDGCAINDHFWIYAAASTDVRFVMTITDTRTGLQRTYGNALGHVAETVTDGFAFPCAP